MVLDGSGIGGVERHVRDLIEGLTRSHGDGVEVHLIAGGDGPLLSAARSAGARVHRVQREPSLLYVARVARCLASIRPALVHAHSGRLACLAARLAGVPVVIETRHGIRERGSRLYQRIPAARRLEWRKSALADITIAVCREDLRWLQEEASFPPQRTRLIPSGVDVPTLGASPHGATRERLRAEWRLDPSARIVGFVGRLSHEKAPERTLELLAALARRGEDAHLAVFGDGPMGDSLRIRAKSLGIERRVHWLGIVPERDAIYPALDLLVIPSHREGLPYVLLDALAYGVPVLVTPVGGMVELLEPAPLRDSVLAFGAEPWAGRAIELLRDPSREARVRAGVERAAGFSSQAMVRAVSALYQECLSARGASTVFDRPPRC